MHITWLNYKSLKAHAFLLHVKNEKKVKKKNEKNATTHRKQSEINAFAKIVKKNEKE